ncbi:MAG: hypothetical protein K0U66_09385 [Gammaproteobacteria bacterium]|nr:hypothetical protein [Gammaproteobacteria bacterium]
MKFGRVALLGAVFAVALAGVSGSGAQAEQNYVPSGHAYGPNFERLPPLNSRQDKIHAQADVYEAEIRRRKVERRIQQERLRQHYDLDLIKPGRSYFDY